MYLPEIPPVRTISYHCMENVLVWVTEGTRAIEFNEYFLEFMALELSRAFDLVDYMVIIKMYFALDF